MNARKLKPLSEPGFYWFIWLPWFSVSLCEASSLHIFILSPPAICYIKRGTWCIMLQSLQNLLRNTNWSLAVIGLKFTQPGSLCWIKN